jgi:hypothetical protein
MVYQLWQETRSDASKKVPRSSHETIVLPKDNVHSYSHKCWRNRSIESKIYLLAHPVRSQENTHYGAGRIASTCFMSIALASSETHRRSDASKASGRLSFLNAG